jgi:hypothetical protein
VNVNPELAVFAKIMLGIFGALGIFAIVVTVRLFMRPAEPSAAKLAATKRTLMLSSWLVIPIVGNAVRALTTREYLLLLVSALLFSYLLPVLVLFFRTRAAIKSAVPSAQN